MLVFIPVLKIPLVYFMSIVMMYKQDRQCTYSITLKRVHETIVAVEKREVLQIYVCVRGARARALR
jgi:hypothetical protein